MAAEGPWVQTSATIKDPEERLAKEIEEFVDFISPNSNETKLRKEALSAVVNTIYDLWPDCAVAVYGSFVTGLELPSSDVDVCVKTPAEIPSNAIANRLRKLRDAMLKNRLTSFDRTNLIARKGMKVPIFAFSLTKSDIEVDICLNNDAPSTPTTMDWLKEYPLLKPLFLVLKHGLSSLSVDGYPNFFMMDTKRNGVASYSLVCMIVRYLQMRKSKKEDIESQATLGKHLLQFLKFWSEFDFQRTGIYVKNGGGLFQKKGKPADSVLRDDQVICIEDPDLDGNNVARASSKIDSVRSGLRKAYKLLQDKVDSSEPGSILASFIYLPDNINGERPCGKMYVLEGLEHAKSNKYTPSRSMVREALSKSHGKRKRSYKGEDSPNDWRHRSDRHDDKSHGKRNREFEWDSKNHHSSKKHKKASYSHSHKRRS